MEHSRLEEMVGAGGAGGSQLSTAWTAPPEGGTTGQVRGTLRTERGVGGGRRRGGWEAGKGRLGCGNIGILPPQEYIHRYLPERVWGT